MRLLGVSETWTKEGYLVAKPYISEVLRVVGSLVYDDSGHRIGRVVDVIGKTSDPRLVVKLEHPDMGELLVSRKERLYYVPRRERGRKKTR